MGFSAEDTYKKMFGSCGTGIGPGGKNICPTPGRRIRSGGTGRGLAYGGGRGPVGIPYGTSPEEEDENTCKTPGRKIRSRGRGRGLARGRGRGPIGRFRS